MSANPDGGDFFDKDQVKNSIPMNQNVTKYDDVLDQFGEDSNRLITDLLTLYATDPQTLDAEQSESASNFVKYNTLSLWFTMQKDFASAKQWANMAMASKEALVAKLEADDTQTLNTTVAVSSSYRTSPLKDL